MKHCMLLLMEDDKEILVGPYGKIEANRFNTDKALLESLGARFVKTIELVRPMDFVKDALDKRIPKP